MEQPWNYPLTTPIRACRVLLRKQWRKFFDEFSQTNHGQRISLEILHTERANQTLIRHAPLMVMIYNRFGKADDLIIEVVRSEIICRYAVASLKEVLIGKNANGKINVIWIADNHGGKVLIRLYAHQAREKQEEHLKNWSN
jgi:hypothetical protein